MSRCILVTTFFDGLTLGEFTMETKHWWRWSARFMAFTIVVGPRLGYAIPIGFEIFPAPHGDMWLAPKRQEPQRISRHP